VSRFEAVGTAARPPRSVACQGRQRLRRVRTSWPVSTPAPSGRGPPRRSGRTGGSSDPVVRLYVAGRCGLGVRSQLRAGAATCVAFPGDDEAGHDLSQLVGVRAVCVVGELPWMRSGTTRRSPSARWPIQAGGMSRASTVTNVPVLSLIPVSRGCDPVGSLSRSTSGQPRDRFCRPRKGLHAPALQGAHRTAHRWSTRRSNGPGRGGCECRPSRQKSDDTEGHRLETVRPGRRSGMRDPSPARRLGTSVG
jgi:hypothetical protein